MTWCQHTIAGLQVGQLRAAAQYSQELWGPVGDEVSSDPQEDGKLNRTYQTGQRPGRQHFGNSV